MKLIEVKDYDEMSQRAADCIIEKIHSTKKPVLGLATGGTPKGLYEALIHDHEQNGTSYGNVTSFNLDEYIGLPKEDPNSYYHYMESNLFNHIDIPEEAVHLPSGTKEDLEEECKDYDAMIEKTGGIELQLLGIGENGHIGFNEPGTSFASGTHIVDLAQSTREANARYFDSLEEVPKRAITMGIATIMKSREIVLLVSGKAKQEAMKRLFEGDITEDFPASILNQHPHVTVIADEEALGLVHQLKAIGQK